MMGMGLKAAQDKKQSVPDERTIPYKEWVKLRENRDKVGFINGRVVPHKSKEGGSVTIGYGHKVLPHEKNLAQGMSEEGAEELLRGDIINAYRKASRFIAERHKVDMTDLSPRQAEMLTDYVFNLGSLKKFPKFTKAVIDRDWETAKKEYKRTYTTAEGKTKELEERNKAFYDRYLADK